MARPRKQGIDYFPFDVDFFEDDKVALIEAEFGYCARYIRPMVIITSGVRTNVCC